jgi:sugar lactone lactonase YvrE
MAGYTPVTVAAVSVVAGSTTNAGTLDLVPAGRIVFTLAGSAGSIGSTDGVGSAARFDLPKGIATDGTNLYVAEYANNTIRKVVISTGAVTTIAGSAGSSGSTDGVGSAALFYWPEGIATDGANLYVAEWANNTIRKVVISTADVTTLAGYASSWGSGGSGNTDGIGSAARFMAPSGIATDGTNLYVTDSYNHTIRKVVISTAAVTTLAGSAGSQGSTDGTGSAARFSFPGGIATDGVNLFVADKSNHTIRKVAIAVRAVTTVAGSAGSPGSADGTGSAARFYSPSGIATDGSNLYVTDMYNYTIRAVR